MGKKQSKANNRTSTHMLLTAEEYENVKVSFRLVCRENPQAGCTYSDFQHLCRDEIDPKLTKFMSHYLFKDDTSKVIDLKTFLMWHDMLVKGSIDDKVAVFMDILVDSNVKAPISIDKLLEYLESVVLSYMMAQKRGKCREYMSWRSLKCPIDANAIHRLAESFCIDLIDKQDIVDFKELETWIMSWRMLRFLHSFVYNKLYQIDQSVDIDDYGETKDLTLFPVAKIAKPFSNLEGFPSVLDICGVMHINYALPDILKGQWRLLYSSVLHGESFSKLVESILGQGPTIVIVKDKLGSIFGGFAPVSWKPSITFYGNRSSFLFTLYPQMYVYEATGQNENYQYFNSKSKTFPNGLGFGGYMGYYGFWLSDEYGTGYSSDTCSTYQDYRILSSKRDFDIHRMEVWAVGAAIIPEVPFLKPTQSVIRPGRSVYQPKSNLHTKPLLGMLGRKGYNDGFSLLSLPEDVESNSVLQEFISDECEDDSEDD